MSGSDSGIVGAIGDIPVGGIPDVAPITIRDEVHTGTELYHMVDRFFGGGLTAGQLHGELQPVCDDGSAGKAQLEHIRHVLNSASSYTGGHLQTELSGILQDLDEAYQGAASGTIQTQFQKAGTLLAQLSPAFSTLAAQINGTQDTLNTAWQVVKNYSRLHADESNVSSLNPFGGGESDDDKAQNAWNAASASLQGIGSQMAATNPGGSHVQIDSTPYIPPNSTNPQANLPDPGSTGPGPGNYQPGSYQPGYHPGTYHPPHVHPGPPGGPGVPGGPGGPGPGYGPGGTGPGYPIGGPGSPGHGYRPGGFGGPGPGSGLDTGSDLASAGPGPGFGGPGPGPGFGGDASGAGSAGGLAGTGAGAGGGSGAAAAGAGGTGGAGGLGAVPLGGRGGAGGRGGERERSTWLTEDDDVWGDSDAPDGVIT